MGSSRWRPSTGVHGSKKTRQRSANQPRFSRAILATGKFPHVARFVEMGAELPDDDGFERALNWILDGIEADLQHQARLKRRDEGKAPDAVRNPAIENDDEKYLPEILSENSGRWWSSGSIGAQR